MNSHWFSGTFPAPFDCLTVSQLSDQDGFGLAAISRGWKGRKYPVSDGRMEKNARSSTTRLAGDDRKATAARITTRCDIEELTAVYI